MLWSLVVLRWIIANARYCVIRQFSLIGYGLEGDHATFCPPFIGYWMGKAYKNIFKQDYIYSYKGFFGDKSFTTLYNYVSEWLVDWSIDLLVPPKLVVVNSFYI